MISSNSFTVFFMEIYTELERGSSAEAPLFFFVHGKAGHKDIMRIFSRGVPEGSHKIFVQAPYPDPRGGFSWWDTDLASFPATQFTQAATALANAITSVPLQYGIAPKTVAALGFSQGSGILSHLLLSKKITLNALIVLAGFIKWPDPVPTQLNDQKIFWAHGEHDDVISIARAQSDIAQLQNLGAQVDFIFDPVGHKIGTSGMRALKSFCSSLDDESYDASSS